MIKKLLPIIFKMLWIKKFRTIFSICAIGLGAGLLVLVLMIQQQMNAAYNDLFEEIERIEVVMDYRTVAETESAPFLEPEVIESIRHSRYISELGVSLDRPQQYNNKSDEFMLPGLIYRGVDNDVLTKTYYRFQQSLGPYEMAISQSLAERLRVQPLDQVTLPLRSEKTILWTVVEIFPNQFDTNMLPIDTALLHLPSLQEVMGLENHVNTAVGRFSSTDNKRLYVDLLQRDLQLDPALNIHILQPNDMLRERIQVVKSFGYALAIIGALLSLVLLLGMMQTSYRERLQELAVLRAIGASPEQTGMLVQLEAMLIGGLSTLFGLSLGVTVGQRGIQYFSSWLGMDLVAGSPNIFGLAIVGILFWSAVIIVSYLPAHRASKVDPLLSFREASLGDSPSVDSAYDDIPTYTEDRLTMFERFAEI